MYIWLKEGYEEKLKKLQEKGKIGKDLYLKIDGDTGKPYIQVIYRLLSPVSMVPIPSDLVERVTVRGERIYEGFRPEGVYRLDNKSAELMAVTDYHYGGGIATKSQLIEISGSSVISVEQIFRLFRENKIKPEVPWDGSLSEEGSDKAAKASETSS